MITTESPPAAPPRRRRRSLALLLVFGLLGIALAIGGASGFVLWGMGGAGSGRPVTVEIPAGATGAEIASRLAEADVIRSAFVFRLIARLRGVDADLKPGVYELRTGLGVEGVIDLLREGIDPTFFRITVPEGKTVREIARIVARGTPIGAEAFMRAARSGDWRVRFLPQGERNLEGFLFPKTYDIAEDATARDVVRLMLRQFEDEVATLDWDRAGRLGVSAYEAIVIASLIEREAQIERDRRLISSVIYNRLGRPMRLQIDATVQYAIFLDTGRYKYPLTTDDYDYPSPYNTYRIDGLPPAPIANPGLASIRAALHPEDTDFYYYLIVNKAGRHEFARTSEEFERLKAQRR